MSEDSSGSASPSVDAVVYPCPRCGASATLGGPCAVCGRAPDPNAAGVFVQDARIAALAPRVEQAQRAYAELSVELADARRKREAFATAVRTAVARERAELEQTGAMTVQTGAMTAPVPTMTAPVAATTAPVAASSAPTASLTGQIAAATGWNRTGPPAAPQSLPQPEASTRTVQNALFILGGLLLGIAAIAFTAVAWANFGVVGRAAILAVITLATLAVPPLVRRRGLTATAETFGALGLLLVLLDGYATWYVNLGGIADSWDEGFYAGTVCAFTAALGYGYARVVGTVGPRFGALLVAQPVLPLLFQESSADIAGWAGIFAAVALGNLGVLWALRRRETAAPGQSGLRALAWLAYAGSLFIALILAALAWILGETLTRATTGSLAVLAVALVFAASTLIVGAAPSAEPVAPVAAAEGAPPARAWSAHRFTAGLVLALALAAALARPALVQWPQQWLLVLTGAAGIVAIAATLLVRQAGLRANSMVIGAGVGSAVAVTVSALAGIGWAALIGTLSTVDATPWWHAQPQAFDGSYHWMLPVSLLLLAGVGWLLAGDLAGGYLRESVLAIAVLSLALALPDHPAVNPWAALIVDLVLAAGALTIGLFAARRRLVTWSVVAGLLVVHALLAGMGTPERAAATLSAVVLLGLAAAAVALRRGGAGRVVGGVAAALTLALAPAAVHNAATAFGVNEVWAWRALLVTSLLTAVWVRLAPAGYLDYAVVGGLLATFYPLWPDLPVGESQAIYSSLGVLAMTVVVSGARVRSLQWAPLVAALLSLTWIGRSLSAVFFAPLAWLGQIWSGRPQGVGLSPAGPDGVIYVVPWQHAIAAGVFVLVGMVLAGPAGRRAVIAAAGLIGIAAVLLTLAALGAPWPVIPAVSLLLGVVALVTAAIRPPAQEWAIVAGGLGTWFTVVGLAGTLPQEWSTITGLALVTVAMAAIAVGGANRVVRTLGWLTGAATKVLLAIAIGQAAELPTEITAYLVLAVAVILLGLAYLPAARDLRLPGEAAAHSAALVALTLCHGQPRSSAVVLALWGVAIGLTVLLTASQDVRILRAAAAGFAEAVAWCLLLRAQYVGTLEAYTVPVALIAVAVGVLIARRRPELSSWLFAGPALAASLLPSLALILVESGLPWRRLLLGLGALVIVIVGSIRRWQAPVVLGGGTLIALAVHELALVWQLLDTWIPIAVAGALLVALAITYERRRRDVVRLRNAIAQMR